MRSSGTSSHFLLAAFGRVAVSGRQVMSDRVGSAGSVCEVKSGDRGGVDVDERRVRMGG